MVRRRLWHCPALARPQARVRPVVRRRCGQGGPHRLRCRERRRDLRAVPVHVRDVVELRRRRQPAGPRLPLLSVPATRWPRLRRGRGAVKQLGSDWNRNRTRVPALSSRTQRTRTRGFSSFFGFWTRWNRGTGGHLILTPRRYHGPSHCCAALRRRMSTQWLRPLKRPTRLRTMPYPTMNRMRTATATLTRCEKLTCSAAE